MVANKTNNTTGDDDDVDDDKFWKSPQTWIIFFFLFIEYTGALIGDKRFSFIVIPLLCFCSFCFLLLITSLKFKSFSFSLSLTFSVVLFSSFTVSLYALLTCNQNYNIYTAKQNISLKEVWNWSYQIYNLSFFCHRKLDDVITIWWVFVQCRWSTSSISNNSIWFLHICRVFIYRTKNKLKQYSYHIHSSCNTRRCSFVLIFFFCSYS